MGLAIIRFGLDEIIANTAPQLKVLQEVISLVVFSFFSILYLRESLRWNDLAAFTLIVVAVAIAMKQ